MATKPFLILFIAPSRLGDAVLASGLVKALAEGAPNARFTIVGSALTTPLFAKVPGLEALIVLEKKPLSLHWLELWRQVSGRHWGLIVDLRGSGLSGRLRRSRRAVYAKSAEGGCHKVVEAARLLRLEADPPAPFLYTDKEIEVRAGTLTAGAGPILAVAPAANWVGKAWPVERFATVARRLLWAGGDLAGGTLMVLGGPGDRAVATPLKASAPGGRLIDLVGTEDILVTYAALKRTRLFIGNDSGLMHLAAAAGAPTLGLFGPSDERRYSPWGPRGRTVRGSRPFEHFVEVDPKLNQAIGHMIDLPTASVLAAAEALITQTVSEAIDA